MMTNIFLGMHAVLHIPGTIVDKEKYDWSAKLCQLAKGSKDSCTDLEKRQTWLNACINLGLSV